MNTPLLMNTSAFLVLPTDVFRTLSVEVQEAVLAAYRGAPAAFGSGEGGPPLPPSTLSEAPLDELDERPNLAPLEFKTLLDGCGAKTRAALKVMCEGPTPVFRVAAVAKAVGCSPSELTGVWAGITKRLRNTTGNRKSYLWKWHEDTETVDGRYVDQGGEMSEVTYNSGRRVFGL